MTPGTSLTKKLGIEEGARVAVVGAPEDFARLLEPLPEGVRVASEMRGTADLIVLFTTSTRDLRRRFRGLVDRLTPAGGVWVAWPKKSSDIDTDLSFEAVQRTGLEAGLVDNKSCSIDGDWQALRFVVPLKDRRRRRG